MISKVDPTGEVVMAWKLKVKGKSKEVSRRSRRREGRRGQASTHSFGPAKA